MATIATERRKMARMDAEYQVFLQSATGVAEGHSRDISMQGMSLVSNQPVQTGAGVDLSIVIQEAHMQFAIKGRVCHCTRFAGSSVAAPDYVLGIEFTEGHEGGLPFLEVDHQNKTFHVTATVSIDVDLETCYKTLSDVTLFPQWAGGIESATVRTRYPDGRPQQVEFTHKFLVRKVRYTDQFSYDDQGHGLSWTNVSSDLDFLRNVGGYTLKAQGPHKTSLTFDANITLSFMPSRRLLNYFTSIMIRKEMKSFKQFAEKRARG